MEVLDRNPLPAMLSHTIQRFPHFYVLMTLYIGMLTSVNEASQTRQKSKILNFTVTYALSVK